MSEMGFQSLQKGCEKSKIFSPFPTVVRWAELDKPCHCAKKSKILSLSVTNHQWIRGVQPPNQTHSRADDEDRDRGTDREDGAKDEIHPKLVSWSNLALEVVLRSKN